MRRQRILAGALLLTAPLLTSCSVPADGIAGVTVDAAGAVFAVIATCTKPLDGATLYASADSGDNKSLTDWEPIGDTTSTPVQLPIVGGPVTGLAPVVTYRDLPPTESSVYGWTRYNSLAASAVSFLPGDLADLTPGQVLTGPWWTEGRGYQHRVVPIERMHDVACEFAGP